MKAFTDEEIRERKDDLAQTVIDIAKIQQEKKEVNDGFKSQLKPLENSKNILLEQIKNKAEYVTEECFKLISHEENMAGYYNSRGELIESRPIKKEERQLTVFHAQRTGTNN